MSPRKTWYVRDDARQWGQPWKQLLELHDALPPKSWTVVGGLMVRIHASHARVHDTRSTRDVDAVLHLETGVITYSQAARTMDQLGYSHQVPVDDQGPAHRFTRPNGEHVDLMVADHLSPSRRPRFGRHSVMEVPGATSMLRYHTVDCVIRDDDGAERIAFSLPDTLGALSLKGGAYLNDSRDRQRHLEDGAVLLATVEDPDQLRGRMQGNDARRVRALVKGIKEGRIARSFPADQGRRIEQVGEALSAGRIAAIADRWKKPSPMPADQRTGGQAPSGSGCAGGPPRQELGAAICEHSCPHHRLS